LNIHKQNRLLCNTKWTSISPGKTNRNTRRYLLF